MPHKVPSSIAHGYLSAIRRQAYPEAEERNRLNIEYMRSHAGRQAEPDSSYTPLPEPVVPLARVLIALAAVQYKLPNGAKRYS